MTMANLIGAVKVVLCVLGSNVAPMTNQQILCERTVGSQILGFLPFE